jgi:CBS domain-containing protein
MRTSSTRTTSTSTASTRTKAITATDVMSSRVATLSPNESIESAMRTFTEARIGGAPVLDAEGRIVGVLSVSDVARAERFDDEPTAGDGRAYDMVEPLDEDLDDELDPEEVYFLKEEYSIAPGVTVADRMTREAVCVAPETTLEQLSEVMVSQRIHRVLVTRGAELLGVVSSFDVVRAVAGRIGNQPRKAKRPARAGKPAMSQRRD